MEEKQRAEKKIREAKGHQFTPKWFELSNEIAPTAWGDLEMYRYNGKYTAYRATLSDLDPAEEVNFGSTEFNPWQYGDLAAQWDIYAQFIQFNNEIFELSSPIINVSLPRVSLRICKNGGKLKNYFEEWLHIPPIYTIVLRDPSERVKSKDIKTEG